MSSTVAVEQYNFELMRQYIAKECCIVISADKSYLFETRLRPLLPETGSVDFNDLYNRVIHDKSGMLREKIIDAITTNETLWFRDEKPWHLFYHKFLPEFVELIESGKTDKIRIWSAACSTGQEPYSLAMMLDRYISEKGTTKISPSHFEILGTDISPSVLFLAMSGRYNKVAMSRGLDDYYKNKYFKESGNVYEIEKSIKDRVTFRKFNLQDSFIPLGRFDLVLCRNVAIYFSQEFKQNLFQRISQSLTDDGSLMIGSSETLLGVSVPFQTTTFDNTIFYKKKG